MAYWGTGVDGSHRILAAECPVDRVNDWRPLGVMIAAEPGTMHNCTGPSFPWLVPVNEKRWLLYFCGWGKFPNRRLPNTTGVAISDDAGKSWRYHDANPMLTLDRPYDAEATGSVAVMHERGRFRMWYTGIGRYFDKPAGVSTGHGDRIPEIGVAYAESDDGLTWSKPMSNWVVPPRHFGVEPFEYICSKPMIFRGDKPGEPAYTLWVNTFGTAYRIHRLTSDDGVTWRWSPRAGPDGELGVGIASAADPTPVPSGRASESPSSLPAPPFDSQQRCYPTILRIGDTLHCWYTGNGFGCTGMGYATADAATLRA